MSCHPSLVHAGLLDVKPQLPAESISVTQRTHYGRHVCKCISHFNLFSPFFQCHMQNRPTAADAGHSAGVINTNTRSTKYRPHSPEYKTSACNAKICGGEKFTTLFQIRTHGNMRSYRQTDVLRRECLSSFVVRFAYLNPVRLWPCRCAFVCMRIIVQLTCMHGWHYAHKCKHPIPVLIFAWQARCNLAVEVISCTQCHLG